MKIIKFKNFESNDITSDFEKYQKNKKLEPLSKDIVVIGKLSDDDYEPIDEPVEIEKIVGIITDPKEIKKIEESVKGAYPLSTDINLKEVKRGELIWVTALLKRPHVTTGFNQTTMGVLKCRIVDVYYGLNILKTVPTLNK